MSASKQFGRYQIIKHLATGGMAEVLLATATGIEGFSRHVVIKQIDPLYSQSPTFVQMFLDEARLAASLHHHNIIQVHDIGKEGATYFFAMEYIHGEDLRNVLVRIRGRNEKTPLEHAITIITAAASALHYAHEHCGPDRKPLNLVHRDVSPSNILIAYDGNVKVVDFGIAKTAMASTETRIGDIKGKFSHMSPEQCQGRPLDRRSDVFALGIVLYELVTVRALFGGDSDFEKMKAIIEGTVHPPSKYRPDLPPELDKIILKALARNPADRYQTAEQLRVALERFAIMNNLRSSTTALADYMKELFGERPEPWLVVDSAPKARVGGAGAKPRQKAVTEGYVDIIVVPDSSPERTDLSDSKTPMAWAPVQQGQTAIVKPKWRLPFVPASVAVGLAMMGVVMAHSSSDTEPVAPVSAASSPVEKGSAVPHVSSATRGAVAPAATPARNSGSQVPAMTNTGAISPGATGAVAPTATSTVAPGATPTATPASGAIPATQVSVAAPAAAVASAPPAPTADATATAVASAPPVPVADATATAVQKRTQISAGTAEPTTAKKPTVQPAKRVAKKKRPAKPAWDPDALTPE